MKAFFLTLILSFIGLQATAAQVDFAHCSDPKDSRVVNIDFRSKVAQVIENGKETLLLYTDTDSGIMNFEGKVYILSFFPNPKSTKGIGNINLADYENNVTMWCQAAK